MRKSFNNSPRKIWNFKIPIIDLFKNDNLNSDKKKCLYNNIYDKIILYKIGFWINFKAEFNTLSLMGLFPAGGCLGPNTMGITLITPLRIKKTNFQMFSFLIFTFK